MTLLKEILINLQFSTESDGVYVDLTLLSGNTYTHSGLSPATTYYYRVRAFKNGVFSEFSEVVGATTFADIVTSNEPDKLTGFKIYPNPTQGELILEKSLQYSDFEQVILCDEQGEVIWKKPVNLLQNSQQLNLTNFPSGMYYLLFVREDKTIVRKIIR